MADRELPQSVWDRMKGSVLHSDTFPDWLKNRSPAPDPDSPSYRRGPPLSLDGGTQAQPQKPPVYPFGDLNGHGY